MAQILTDECEKQLNGVSEAMDLLHIEVETDDVEDKPGREDAQYSVSLRITSKTFDLACLDFQGSSLNNNYFHCQYIVF